MVRQATLFELPPATTVQPFTKGLLKWVGSKQKMAHIIASALPREFGTYYEPFLGSAAVLGTLAPHCAVGSDVFGPLMEIWSTLSIDPDLVRKWYEERWHRMMDGQKIQVYEEIKASYNRHPNGADFLFLCRSCYGGIIRFRKADGYMSTPCGAHTPMPPSTFAGRLDDWSRRTAGTTFVQSEYEAVMDLAQEGDVIYCDPPYSYSQQILYGAQGFSLQRLFEVIARCKNRGVRVALSIDGHKQNGEAVYDIPLPEGLFERQLMVTVGRSMLKRFQMQGQSLHREVVSDRLLLTY